MARESRVVFGVGPVSELLRVRPDDIVKLCTSRPGSISDRAREAGVQVEQVAPAELDRLSGPGATHQGVVAVVGPYRYADVDDILTAAADSGRPALVVALDGVTDPHNLGAVVRSAHLLGAHGVMIPQDRAASVNAIATKSSAGATESMNIARVTNLARALSELKESGLWLACVASAGSAIPLRELDASGAVGLVLGSEGKGVRPRVARACDYAVEIPMLGQAVGSFNVSVAAAIALYEVSRQRGA